MRKRLTAINAISTILMVTLIASRNRLMEFSRYCDSVRRPGQDNRLIWRSPHVQPRFVSLHLELNGAKLAISDGSVVGQSDPELLAWEMF